LLTSLLVFKEHSLSGLQSPPVPARRNQLRAAGDQRDVFSELSVLRRQLRCEQKRLEGRLQQDDWEELDSLLSDRHQERPHVDVFDMARLRLQAPVRRPTSRNTEPRNLLQIHNSLQLKHADGEARVASREDPKRDEVGMASRRRRDYEFISQRSTAQDEYLDLSPPQHKHDLRSATGGSARGSLLESESAFIDPLGDAFPMPPTPEIQKPSQLSARERRRLAKQSQRPHDRTSCSELAEQQGAYNQQAERRQQQEGQQSGGGRSQDRTGRLMALSHHSNTAESVDLSDDGSSPLHFSLNRRSADSAATDPWMRPGTSDTLKCLDRPMRRERLKIQDVHRDWEEPPTYHS
ncbi:hypothetical protein LDENG_00102670, partial [Lucifuga dentata]